MSRTLDEIAVILALNVLIAVAVFAVGSGPLQEESTPVPAYPAGQAGCLGAPAIPLSDTSVAGRAWLCILDEGVRPGMELEGLTPELAYTAWVMYFDRPGVCRTTVCGLEDLLGDDPVGVLGRMDGAVGNGTRKTHFAGDYRDLRLTRGSRVTLLVMGHGRAGTGDTRQRARQLLTPQFPRLGAPVAGAVVDGEVPIAVAHAVFDLPSGLLDQWPR